MTTDHTFSFLPGGIDAKDLAVRIEYGHEPNSRTYCTQSFIVPRSELPRLIREAQRILDAKPALDPTGEGEKE